MSIRNFWTIFKKDVAVGPRSPFVLFAILLPIALTIVLQMVFGDLFAQKPRFALVDQGSSQISVLIQDIDGINVTMLSDPEELKQQVQSHDFDAGLILQPGFDQALKGGEKPVMQFYISGESYAIDRLILSVTAIDLIRTVEGSSPPVEVELVSHGRGEALPISMRLVPIIAMYAFIIAGLFVPASSLVEERERKTIQAVLVSPAKLSDLLAAKAVLGIVLTIIMTVVTLLLNGAFTHNQLDMIVVLIVAAIFWSMLGLVVGLLASNSQILFAIVKGSGALLFAPVIFYLFPDWPQWIAKMFPTFWAIDPVWQILANHATLADIILPLMVTAGMSIVLIPIVAKLGRRMLVQLASS